MHYPAVSLEAQRREVYSAGYDEAPVLLPGPAPALSVFRHPRRTVPHPVSFFEGT